MCLAFETIVNYTVAASALPFKMQHYTYHPPSSSSTRPNSHATQQTRQSWQDASSIPNKPHEAWPHYLPPPLDDSFTFSSIPLEEEPDLVHNGLPAERLSNLNIEIGREHIRYKARPLSLISSASATSSGTCLSSITPTEGGSEANTITGPSRETSPQQRLKSEPALGRDVITYACSWGGCRAVFKTHAALSWHVKAEHLLICPVETCAGGPFGSVRVVEGHVDVVHLMKEKGVRDWSLEVGRKVVEGEGEMVRGAGREGKVDEASKKDKGAAEEKNVIEAKKRKCQDDLDKAMERKAKRTKKGTSEYALLCAIVDDADIDQIPHPATAQPKPQPTSLASP